MKRQFVHIFALTKPRAYTTGYVVTKGPRNITWTTYQKDREGPYWPRGMKKEALEYAESLAKEEKLELLLHC